MKFGYFPIQDCVGAILAHATKTGDRQFKKGRKLDGDDIRMLALAGQDQIMVALPESGDMDENDAADKIGTAMLATNIKKSDAAAGRVNLYAESDGLLTLDETAVHAVNNLDERITLATLAHMEPVKAGQMIATIKIIPFALPGSIVESVAALARSKGVMKIWPFKAKTVGLIQTRHDASPDKSLDKTADRLTHRLKQWGSRLKLRIRCKHENTAIAKAIRNLIKNRCDLIIIFGASAISDRKDVVPAAITGAGGEIERLGMPMDPGNLLLLAGLSAVPIIGAPGCAKSPSPNGFDHILVRILAGLNPGSGDIALMGPGGLLKEIPSRPRPREIAKHRISGKKLPHVTALILAAGQSRRMGKQNKLLSMLDNKPMLVHAIEAAKASKAASVLMVTGFDCDKIRKTAPGINTIHNAGYENGMASSLNTGIAALPDESDAVIIMLGDMPRISAKTLNALIAGFDPDKGRHICVPVCQGKQGNPVLFARMYFDALKSLQGDHGAKKLLEDNEGDVFEVTVDDPAIFFDIDTEQAMQTLVNSPEEAG